MFDRLGAAWGSVPERTGLVGSLANALDPDNWLPGGRDAAFEAYIKERVDATAQRAAAAGAAGPGQAMRGGEVGADGEESFHGVAEHIGDALLGLVRP